MVQVAAIDLVEATETQGDAQPPIRIAPVVVRAVADLAFDYAGGSSVGDTKSSLGDGR